MKLNAKFFDGNSALSQSIEVVLSSDGIRLPSGELWKYDHLILIASDKANGSLSYKNKNNNELRLTLLFNEGLDDPARDYLNRLSNKLTGDSNWYFIRWQLLTALGIVGLMFTFYLIYPYFNRAIVAVIPNSWAIKAGDLVLDGLYQEYSSNVCHTIEGDKALEKLVATLEIDDLSYPLRVEVVDNPQVNALTAPGGRIVVFSGLIKQATSSDEVAGILAHEIGHVYYQHPMQGLVNVLGFSIVGSFFGGDAASIAIVGLSLSYSRDLERAADEKALSILLQNNISAQGILNFFERMQDNNKDNVVTEIENIFSSHPLSEERIASFSNHIDKNEINRQFIHALTTKEWKSLKDICYSPNGNVE